MPQTTNKGIRTNYEVVGSDSPLILQLVLFRGLEGWPRVGHVHAV